MIEKIKKVMNELNPSCIIDLSIIYSNYLNSQNIFQITSSVIHNDFKNTCDRKSGIDFFIKKSLCQFQTKSTYSQNLKLCLQYQK